MSKLLLVYAYKLLLVYTYFTLIKKSLNRNELKNYMIRLINICISKKTICPLFDFRGDMCLLGVKRSIFSNVFFYEKLNFLPIDFIII